MQQNYHQSLLQRPRRLFSKRPPPKRESVPAKPLAATTPPVEQAIRPQARIRLRKAACGDHPPVLASDRPPQARIRLRKAACGDHPPVEQATSPPKRESVPAKPLAATTRRLSKRPARLSPLVARLLFRLCCSSREKSLAPTEALSSVLISVISPSHRVQNRGLPVSPFPRMAC